MFLIRFKKKRNKFTPFCMLKTCRVGIVLGPRRVGTGLVPWRANPHLWGSWRGARGCCFSGRKWNGHKWNDWGLWNKPPPPGQSSAKLIFALVAAGGTNFLMDKNVSELSFELSKNSFTTICPQEQEQEYSIVFERFEDKYLLSCLDVLVRNSNSGK